MSSELRKSTRIIKKNRKYFDEDDGNVIIKAIPLIEKRQEKLLPKVIPMAENNESANAVHVDEENASANVEENKSVNAIPLADEFEKLKKEFEEEKKKSSTQFREILKKLESINNGIRNISSIINTAVNQQMLQEALSSQLRTCFNAIGEEIENIEF